MDINTDKYTEARRMLLDYIRQVAIEKKITHQQIADATGFTSNNVSRMLQGRYAPSIDNFIKLADAVGVFFYIEDKESNSDINQIMKKRWKNNSKN